MNEIKSFLNSKHVRKSLHIKKTENMTCTKVRLTDEDFSTGSYSQFTEIPNDKIIQLVDRFFSLDANANFEAIFPMMFSWVMQLSNQEEILKQIQEKLDELEVSDYSKERLLFCLHELISNSLFAAEPELKANIKQRAIINLKPIEIKIFIGPEFNSIFVRDFNGLFDQSSQQKAFGKDLDSPSIVNIKKSAGAGVGLQVVRELCSLLIFRQKPNHWTEASAFFVKRCYAQAPLIFKQI